MVVQVLVDVFDVIFFIVVFIFVGYRLEDAGGWKEAELGVESFVRVVRVGVELYEKQRRRRPYLNVTTQPAQVGDHRCFHVTTVVHLYAVSAR